MGEGAHADTSLLPRRHLLHDRQGAEAIERLKVAVLPSKGARLPRAASSRRLARRHGAPRAAHPSSSRPSNGVDASRFKESVYASASQKRRKSGASVLNRVELDVAYAQRRLTSSAHWVYAARGDRAARARAPPLPQGHAPRGQQQRAARTARGQLDARTAPPSGAEKCMRI